MKPNVAVLGGGNLYSSTRKVLEVLGDDIKSGLRRNARVLVKPNMVSDGIQLSATERDSIKAVLDYLRGFDLGEVVVGEGASAGQDTWKAYKKFDYLSLKKEFDVEFVDFNEDIEDYELLELEGYDCTLEARVSKRILDFDYKISLAKTKTHDTAIITLSLKNMMGGLVGSDTIKMHGAPSFSEIDYRRSVKVIHRNLLKIIRLLKPDLAVIDGFNGMEGNGPCYGTKKSLSVVIASVDALAADAVGATLMGFNPTEVGYMVYAAEEKLGVIDLNEINVVGPPVDSIKKPFKPHSDYLIQKNWR